ncbi:tRNA epoxyqueuosine(34) reductase QueG [Terasakiella pusilla]|uniref:tRNA epoxyqueuosine(34) reductase QueG n=1 Tax=Terasakiella pusilla TaxID=64973 RepID=UPI003AA87869
MDNPKDIIRTLALEMGFDAVGFCAAETSDQAKADLAEFNRQGLYGTMDWMHTTEDRRADPKVLWDGAKSIIVLGMNYGPDYDPMDRLTQTDTGVISCYAQNKDYHDTVKKRLKRLAREMMARWPEDELKVFVDTAPVLEKPIAAQTSVGWQGKHTCIVSRVFGSWLFLGEVYTTLALEPDAPEKNHCGSCSSCLDICPTDAFLKDGQIDARKCISYLTIEHDGLIDPDLAVKMGNRIYGCDDCLAICPWTKFSKVTTEETFKPRPEFREPDLGMLVAFDDETFREFFRASPVKRIKRHRFIRNVLIAIANAKRVDLKDKVEVLTKDDHEVIAKTASWCLTHLDEV